MPHNPKGDLQVSKTKAELLDDIEALRDEVEALEEENEDLLDELEEIAGD